MATAGAADLVAAAAGLGACAARGRTEILTWPGVQQSEDVAADAGLCRAERVQLWAGVLPAADREGTWGTHRLDWTGECAALHVCIRGDDLLGLPFRYPRRADLARRGRGSGRCRRAGGLRPHRRRPPGPDDDRAVHRDDGSAIAGPDILVAAERHADWR